MKKLFTFFLLLSYIGMAAQNFGQTNIDLTTDSFATNSYQEDSDTAESFSMSETFEEAAERNKIPYRTFESLEDVQIGYYIITGVFSEGKNLKKAIKNLSKKGFPSGSILNPKNNLNYVYLQYYPYGLEAIDACLDSFNGKYEEDVWILSIENNNVLMADSSSTESNETDKEQSDDLMDMNSSTDTYIDENTPSNVSMTENSTTESTLTDDLQSDDLMDMNSSTDTYIDENTPSNVSMTENSTTESTLTDDLQSNDWLNTNVSTDTYIDENTPSNVSTVNSSTENTLTDDLQSNDWLNTNTSTENKLTDDEQSNDWLTTSSSIENNVMDNEPSDVLITTDLPTANTIDFDEEFNVEDDLVESNTSNKKSNSNTSKLLKKADYNFSKMWYAEAAEIYEEVLSSEENQTYEIIEKAADSYYFHSNMEKAYEWYDKLYTDHGDQMSSDNIFKYAHSLKGTGKYARSKRLMRLYNKKLKNDDSADLDSNAILPNEIVLDKILNKESKYNLKNLDINTKYSDFSPMFLGDDKVVFASSKDSSVLNTRRYKWNNQPFLDLYVAKVNEESQELNDVIKFSKKINTKYHEASVTFSPDNETMYFTRNNYSKKLRRDKTGVNHLKIYTSKKVDEKWQQAVEVPFNSDDYSTGHPALSPDGKQLYFVSDMPGTIGETDIFVVDVKGDNSFSEPRNLGPQINTDRKEMFPFINEKKLYFSSNGHTGLGGLDIFGATYTEEEGFGKVRNLGQPVNSNKDDFSYIVNEENQKGFFASNRIGGKGDDDIYSFERLEPEEVHAATTAIAGVVTELITGDIMPKALIEILDENGIKLKEMVTEEDGSFIFEDLEADKKYTIKTSRETYFEDVQNITAIENDTTQVNLVMRKLSDDELVDFAMQNLQEVIAIEDGIKKIKTDMIYFDFDKSFVRDDSALELDKLVEVMTEYTNMVIKIESHTDSRGDRAYNKYLSDLRAKSTRDYIISQGISPERIQSAIGYGEENLLNQCDGSVACTEEEHVLNRRSEFIIVKM